jgi:hypothetical protein
LNYIGPSLDVVKRNDKFAGTQKFTAGSSYEFRTGSRMVAEVSSENRLITT